MSRVYARLRLSNGQQVDLAPGDIIGRLGTAALHLTDPNVSEAHAMVSYRQQALKLVSLRGQLRVDGAVVDKVTLRAGLEVGLTDQIALVVVEVCFPEVLRTLKIVGRDPLELVRGRYSLLAGPPLQVREGAWRGSAADIWSGDEGWFIRQEGAGAERMVEGRQWLIGGERVTLGRHAGLSTIPVAPPLRVTAYYDTVHLHRSGHPLVKLAGVPARIISELSLFDGPVSWRALVRELYPAERSKDPAAQRGRLDMNHVRLRKKLRAAGIRADLVRATGTGHYELVLMEGDQLDSRV